MLEKEVTITLIRYNNIKDFKPPAWRRLYELAIDSHDLRWQLNEINFTNEEDREKKLLFSMQFIRTWYDDDLIVWSLQLAVCKFASMDVNTDKSLYSSSSSILCYRHLLTACADPYPQAYRFVLSGQGLFYYNIFLLNVIISFGIHTMLYDYLFKFTLLVSFSI